MIIGIPKGLLYYKYNIFFETFFNELGAKVINSENTNKKILNEGVKYSVDDACLPIKIFHGHVVSLRSRCDLMLIPRIMQLEKREYICPKFCGLPEMIINSIPDMPKTIKEPIYATSRKSLYRWGKEVGSLITKDKMKIKNAFNLAIEKQNNFKSGIRDRGYKTNIALVGHPYNIYDDFINMDIIKKLNHLGVGVITEEYTEKEEIKKEVESLYKRPFWTFAKNSYGFVLNSIKQEKVKGVIYISSFACGIDSVITELIKDKIGDFPFMILKLDEHTGEAGINTRIEAFTDMLERSF